MAVKKHFTEEQILDFLKQAEAGVPVKARCRRHGFSDASFYNWRAKVGGMTVRASKSESRSDCGRTAASGRGCVKIYGHPHFCNTDQR
jgi:putative transposase